MPYVIRHPKNGFFVDFRQCNYAEFGNLQYAFRFKNESLAEKIAYVAGGWVYGESELQDHEKVVPD